MDTGKAALSIGERADGRPRDPSGETITSSLGLSVHFSLVESVFQVVYII